MAEAELTATAAAHAVSAVAQRLARSGISSARSEATTLVSTVTGRSRELLLSHPDTLLSTHEMRQLEALALRRAKREPLPYVIGEAEFYSLPFRVDPRVIVPRPETEILAEAAIVRARAQRARLIADVGTGSGALAVVIARAMPHSRILGIDVSIAALLLARDNCQRHEVAESVALVCADLLEAIRERIDCIVANLPYVRSDEFAGLEPEVREFEPRIALDGGPDGMAQIRRLSARLRHNLSRGGFAALEVGAGQAAEVAKLLLAGGLRDVEVVEDYSGMERVVIGWHRG
jgi:release factor glutamine methyltransferase